jgi:hypothetical protein
VGRHGEAKSEALDFKPHLDGYPSILLHAVLFTYGLVLPRYYSVPAEKLGLFLVPLALGNWLGPITLGRLFDTVGRKPMIAGTYIASGVLFALTAWLFQIGVLTAFTPAVCWSVMFFVASSAASAAYLTVSEIFPLETASARWCCHGAVRRTAHCRDGGSGQRERAFQLCARRRSVSNGPGREFLAIACLDGLQSSWASTRVFGVDDCRRRRWDSLSDANARNEAG